MSIVEFLLARIAEDEAAAMAATPGTWLVDHPSYPEAIHSDYTAVVSGGRWGGEAPVFNSDEDAHHIARHDPARVLADCKAKRRIVNAYRAGFPDEDRYAMGWHDSHVGTLSVLAMPYADHPDFDSAWR